MLTRAEAIIEIAKNNLVLDITLYGQKQNVNTSKVLAKLITTMAPVDELLSGTKKKTSKKKKKTSLKQDLMKGSLLGPSFSDNYIKKLEYKYSAVSKQFDSFDGLTEF